MSIQRCKDIRIIDSSLRLAKERKVKCMCFFATEYSRRVLSTPVRASRLEMLLLDKVRRRAEVQVVPERRVNPSRNWGLLG